MRQRAAAGLAPGQHHLHAKAVEQFNAGVINARHQHRLHTTIEQHHALFALLNRISADFIAGAGGQCGGCKIDHRRHAPANYRKFEQQWLERLGQYRAQQGKAEAVGIGHQRAQQPAQKAVTPRALIGLFNIGAGMIHEVHIMHAGGASGHAGEAGEAAVNMFDHLFCRRFAIFQHVLDHINAATRTVEFVAQEQIGRAGGGAKTAMDAGAQDFFRRLHMGVGQLRRAEIGLHFIVPNTCDPD